MIDFDALYTAHAARLRGYLVANGMDEHGAADVVQETFLRIWKRRDELVDDASQLSGLVWRTAKNLRIDGFRKQSRVTLQGEIGEDEGGVAPPPPLPSDTAHLRARLNAAFAQLPPTLREAYTLFQIMDLSIAEIARRVGTSEANVKVRIFRAKEKLRPLLKDLIDEDRGGRT